ncbi:hypothetical protein QUN99_003376 [Vibrio parahaemolyticus]|nr:hypothetical protein [Vibrio parahaemolyticus]
MKNWLKTQRALEKDVLERVKSSLLKALITMLSGFFAFAIVTAVKLLMNGNRMHELYLIIALLIVPAGISLWYILKSNNERKFEARFSRVLKREAWRSTINSLLVFYIGFEVYYGWLGIISIQFDGYYDTLSEFERQRVVVYEPILHVIKSVGFYVCISVSFNSLFNYITADSEHRKKTLTPNSDSQNQTA